MIDCSDYSIVKAEEDFNKLTIDNMVKPVLNKEFEELRKDLIEKRDKLFDEFGFDKGIEIVGKYKFDLLYGLELYELFDSKYNFSNRDASDDKVWMFLSVRVIPDVVHSRHGKSEGRFYSNSRRIWLKQIWWYIHLSWFKDRNSTFEILKNNTTDDVVQLVERPGLGYNVDLYREIMKQLSIYNKKNKRLLRKVMVLNTARLQTINPELTKDGIEGYVEELFNTIIK